MYDDVDRLAGCLVNLAFVEQRRGDLARAVALDRRAVAELHRIGHGFEAGARANLAHRLVDAGAFGDAADAAAQAMATADRIGDGLVRADARYAAARLALASGDASEAAERAEQSLAILRAIGTTSMVREVEAVLAAARSAGATSPAAVTPIRSGTSPD